MNLCNDENLKLISLIRTLVNNTIKEEFKNRISNEESIIGFREVLSIASDSEVLSNGVAIQGTFDLDRALEEHSEVKEFLLKLSSRIINLLTPDVYEELIAEFSTDTNYKNSVRYAESEFIKTKEFLRNNPMIFVLLFFNSKTLTPYLL